MKPETDSLYSVRRPEVNVLPSVALPIYPRSIGHFLFRNGMTEYYPGKERPFVQFYWGVDGSGEFMVDGKPSVMLPGDVLYRLPGEDHLHRSLTPRWEYRWVVFDGPFAETFMRSYHYPRTCFHAGKVPHDLFLKLENRMRERSPFCWREMVAIIAEILARAGGMYDVETREGRIVRDVIRLCRENFTDPSLNVNALAEMMGMDRSTIRRIFQKRMNILPGRYISDLRLQHALSRLHETLLPLREIARESGFSDPTYLCRIIRAKTGLTPDAFRGRERGMSSVSLQKEILP